MYNGYYLFYKLSFSKFVEVYKKSGRPLILGILCGQIPVLFWIGFCYVSLFHYSHMGGYASYGDEEH